MGRQFVWAAAPMLLAATRAAIACGGALPPTLPLEGMISGDTCSGNPNPPCDSVTYPSPIVTSRFTLDQPTYLELAYYGAAAFAPIVYLSGDGCGEDGCGSELPAGSYCVTVTADPASADGTCGCFTLYIHTWVDTILRDGFDG